MYPDCGVSVIVEILQAVSAANHEEAIKSVIPHLSLLDAHLKVVVGS